MTTPHVLLVDNDRLDLELTRGLLEQIEPNARVSVADGGEEALAYLRGTESLPDLVLLDINMPRLTGFEVLERLREDEGTSTLPVVLFSTSREARDVERGFAGGASEYCVKPTRLDALEELLQDLMTRWCASP